MLPGSSHELRAPSTKLRVLVVDDELLARERLRHLLRLESDVEVVGDCADGREALAAIRSLTPDVVLLDINMPGCDGLQVAAELPAAARPVVIFVTAHQHHAVDAFNARATDYLLKPFDRERLQVALQRAREQIQAQRNAAPATVPKPDRLALKTAGRIVFVRPEDIVWVEAANNYSIMHLGDRQSLRLRETLAALEEQLGTAQFARINRSALVHVDQVQELRPTKHGDYVVVLRTGLELPLSRGMRAGFERLYLAGA